MWPFCSSLRGRNESLNHRLAMQRASSLGGNSSSYCSILFLIFCIDRNRQRGVEVRCRALGADIWSEGRLRENFTWRKLLISANIIAKCAAIAIRRSHSGSSLAILRRPFLGCGRVDQERTTVDHIAFTIGLSERQGSEALSRTALTRGSRYGIRRSEPE